MFHDLVNSKCYMKQSRTSLSQMSGSLHAPIPTSPFIVSHRLSPLNGTAPFVRCKARFEAVRHSGKLDSRKKKSVAKKLVARKF